MNIWVPSPPFWIQTPLNRLIWSNYADSSKRKLLGWRRCRNPTFRPRALAPPPAATQNRGFALQTGRGKPLLACDTKPILRNVSLVCAVADNCVVGMEGLAPPLLRRKTMVLCRKQEGHVCCVTQQTCLLYHTVDVSVVSHSWIPIKSNYFFWGSREQPRLACITFII